MHMTTTMATTTKRKRVLVAMSGGVDSAVAALLCQEADFDCVGVTLRLQTPCGGEDCCTESDIADARRVAEMLGIPFEVLDLSRDFHREVIDAFVSEYEAGNTPNPCVRCNHLVKFAALQAYADKIGCDYVATGHYARLGCTKEGVYQLKRAASRQKDQSYMLYALTQKQLSHVLFPLGGFTSKDQIRAFAEARDIPIADKSDSQDICFIPDGDYAAFIAQYTGKTYADGDFVDEEGRVLGRHRGLFRYTVGQRRGLGLALKESLYVKEKDVANNRVVLAPDAHLYADSLIADQFTWCAGKPPQDMSLITAKTRYRMQDSLASAEVLPDGRVRVRFSLPERAITPGQSVVLYAGDLVLGGGIIVGAE